MADTSMTETIVFYSPKSRLASVLGVLAKYTFLALPFLVYFLVDGGKFLPIWLGVLISTVIGIALMVKSDGIVAPLIGRLTVFIFSETEVKIHSEAGMETFLLWDLKSIQAFEVKGEISVQHLKLETPDGRIFDIFETWVTSKTTPAFQRLCLRFEAK